MAIAFSAVPVVEGRAPANPLAVKGNGMYTRTFRCTVPADTTAATLPIGWLPPGTVVVAASIDADTSLATTTLALSTSEQTFVAAKVQTVTGGEGCIIVANKNVVVKCSTSAGLAVNLVAATATTPSSVIVVDVTLVLASILPPEDTYSTQST
jgi:hypothetical protein